MDGVIRASIPVQLSASQAQIVYSEETQSYSLTFGISVTLPVNDLVESLLRLNPQTQATACKQDEPVLDDSFLEQIGSQLLLQSEASQPIIDEVIVSSPVEISEPLAPDDVIAHASASVVEVEPVLSEVEDLPQKEVDPVLKAFSDIPISLIRQDGSYLDYLQRSRWHYGESKFVVKDFVKRVDKKMKREQEQSNAYMCQKKQRSSSTATTVSSCSDRRLSADAPAFTPSWTRNRAYSDYKIPNIKPQSRSPQPCVTGYESLVSTERIESPVLLEENHKGGRSRAMTTSAFWSPPTVEEEQQNDSSAANTLISADSFSSKRDHMQERSRSSSLSDNSCKQM